jgi:hypothetical protein
MKMSAYDRKIMLAEIDQLAKALRDEYHKMPASVQSAAVLIGHTLSSLRSRIGGKNK